MKLQMNYPPLLQLGQVLNTVVLLVLIQMLGCKKKPEPPIVSGEHPLRGQAEPLDGTFGQIGVVKEGIYLDYTGLFSVDVPEDWEVTQGNLFGERRLELHHEIEDYYVEVWRFPGVQYRPTTREDCIWAFIDRGLYSDWSNNRLTNVGTCYPTGDSNYVIFVYIKHWQGFTWQLEGHVSLDVLVEGERETRERIQSIRWNVVESVQKPIVP